MNFRLFKLVIITIGYILGERYTYADDAQSDGNSWRDCEIFLAPSSLPGGGWGVYAGRDFAENEIVEITPLHIPVAHKVPVVRNSVMDDYVYGFLRWDEDKREFLHMVVIAFGNIMFYNHSPQPNLRWISYGREPTSTKRHNAMATCFVAQRRIEAGEELFSTYGAQDGGKEWFRNRRLQLMEIPSYASRKNGTVYEQDKQRYCSKVYAGYGRPRWQSGVIASLNEQDKRYKMNMDRLSDFDSPVAVVNQDVSAGTTLEMSPGLVLSKEKVVDTPVATLSFFWGDWNLEQQQSLRELRATGNLRVQHQDRKTNWVREDQFNGFEDVVVVPAGGNIALVERVVEKTDDAEAKLSAGDYCFGQHEIIITC